MTNHISLMVGYTNQLRDLAMIQNWIDAAREGATDNQVLQSALEHRQTELIIKQAKIEDEMFEIYSNN